MKVVACYKCVPSSESISVSRDRSLDMSQAQWEIGQYDLRAIEAASKLAADGGVVVGLTAGGDIVDNSKMKKALLARGPQEMFGVRDEALDSADSVAVASVLASAIGKIGDVDLAIFGEGSGDMYVKQMGNITGALLGWTTVNAVCDIEPIEGGLRVKRVVDDGVETLEIGLPAALSVTADINVPRIPTMRDIMGAGKKPSTIWSLADVGASVCPTTETESILAPEGTDRKKIILSGCSEDVIQQFSSYLKSVL